MVEEVISEVWLTHAVNNATNNRLDTGLHVICTTKSQCGHLQKHSQSSTSKKQLMNTLQLLIFALIHIGSSVKFIKKKTKKNTPTVVNKVSLKLSWCYSHFWKSQKRRKDLLYSNYGYIHLTEGYWVLDTRILVQLMSIFGADIRLKHTREYQRFASALFRFFFLCFFFSPSVQKRGKNAPVIQTNGETTTVPDCQCRWKTFIWNSNA